MQAGDRKQGINKAWSHIPLGLHYSNCYEVHTDQITTSMVFALRLRQQHDTRSMYYNVMYNALSLTIIGGI